MCIVLEWERNTESSSTPRLRGTKLRTQIGKVDLTMSASHGESLSAVFQNFLPLFGLRNLRIWGG